MEWIQVLTIIGTLGAFIMWQTNRIDSDIKAIDNRLSNDIKGAHRRMDQLYQVIIDIQKEIKQIYIDNVK